MENTKLNNPLRNSILEFKDAFIAAGAFSFACNLFMLMPTIYMLQVYDRVLTSRNIYTLAMLTLIMLATYAIEAAIDFTKAKLLVKTSSAMELKLGSEVFNAAFRAHLRSRNNNPTQALADLSNIRQYLTSRGLTVFFDLPWSPIYIAIVFILSPWLGLFALASVAIQALLSVANEKATASLLQEANTKAIHSGNSAGEALRNSEAIEAMGMLKGVRNRWFSRQQEILSLQADASDRAAKITAISRFVRIATQSGILGLGSLLVLENQLSVGGMSAAMILLGRALSPIDAAIATWKSTISARSAYGRLSKLMLESSTKSESSITLPRPQGHLLLEGVSVTPPNAKTPTLKEINLKIKAGTLVAVIGPSAAGKSSLARALVGVWEPTQGSVRLDGADLSRWDKDDLGQWIGYLPQDVELMEGTIAENIARFGDIDNEKVIAAAQRAGVHQMILRLPSGYETPIGIGAAVLSGGQRQRIGLARALYDNPSIIVLDEPNANLDQAGDHALAKTLEQLKQDRKTVILMTHRMGVVNLADEILVMSDGQVRMHGPRDEVLKRLKPQASRAQQGAANAKA